MEKEFNQIEYINAYNREKYDRITILVPKGRKEEIKATAKKEGLSVNEYIINAIKAWEACRSIP